MCAGYFPKRKQVGRGLVVVTGEELVRYAGVLPVPGESEPGCRKHSGSSVRPLNGASRNSVFVDWLPCLRPNVVPLCFPDIRKDRKESRSAACPGHVKFSVSDCRRGSGPAKIVEMLLLTGAPVGQLLGVSRYYRKTACPFQGCSRCVRLRPCLPPLDELGRGLACAWRGRPRIEARCADPSYRHPMP